MSNTITSAVIGKLEQHAEFSDWWEHGPVAIPFFDNAQIPVTFSDYVPEEDAQFMAEADAALTNFLRLDADYRLSISEHAWLNFADFADEVGVNGIPKKMRVLTDEKLIWKHIHPTKIYVTRRPYNEQDIYVQVACECDWEPEHGLQLVFRQGRKLTRVSNQDGHLTEADAWDKPDEED